MRTVWALLLTVAFTPSAVTGQTVAVLKMGTPASSAFGPVQNGRVTLTLASGTRITVPVTDLDVDLMRSLLGAPNPGPAGQTSAMSPGELLLSPSAQDSAIRAKCQSEWRDDFQMQAFCQKQQREAVSTLSGRSMSSGDQRTIRSMRRRMAGRFSDVELLRGTTAEGAPAIAALKWIT